ncbi:MAG: hypothetical protein EXX96DRAFT_183314 [Benjaminiella poitrasii]|nr:MAG: hypothetical protein EXX96DRAFT_183314 [Benjaminiella poitrasii]
MTVPLPASLKDSKCILHIDLDCFYCQVEQVRLGIPFDEPVAVQQWQNLIAVNYAAREFGIQKMSTLRDAQKACPNLRLVHVATYGPHDLEPQYHAHPDRSTHKVSLDVYRTASREIFKIFGRHVPVIQKIGTDEGFMDVTELVNDRLRERYANELMLSSESCGVVVDWDSLGYTVKSDQESEVGAWSAVTTWRDLQLALGAEVAAAIRKEVYDELHYFCSAGIAHHKVLAKLCSSRNKPNKQTILRECARLDFMRDIPFTKIRNLGGKLGNEVGSEFEVMNASELWKYSMQDLQNKFGESTGTYLYNICRGIDNEEVSPTKAPKSIMAAKSFNPAIKSPQEMEKWFGILAAELQNRIMRHFEEYSTWPKTITVRYASFHHRTYRSKSLRSFSQSELKTPEMIAKRCGQLFNSLGDGYPCIGLDFCASNFGSNESSKSYNINQFFSKTTDAIHDSSPDDSTSNNSSQSPSIAVTDTNKKKKGGGLLLDYLAKNSPREDTTDESTFICERCSERIAVVSTEEHSDYHFALDLMKEERQQSPKKRENNEMDEQTIKKRKKALFFQPRTQS